MEDLMNNAKDMPVYAALLLYAPALFVPAFITFLMEGDWVSLVFVSVMLFFFVLVNTVVLQLVSAALFKKNFWVLMLPVTIACMVAMYFQSYSMELIGWTAAAGFVATLTMLVTAYPIIRSRITLRQLRWEGYRQKMSKKAYTQACREKLGAVIFHPLAFLFFLSYTNGYSLSNALATKPESTSVDDDDEDWDADSSFSNAVSYDDSDGFGKGGTFDYAAGTGIFSNLWD